MTFNKEQRNSLRESLKYSKRGLDLYVFDCNDNIYLEEKGMKDYKWLKSPLTTDDIAKGDVCSKEKVETLIFNRMGKFDEDDRMEFFIETTTIETTNSCQIWFISTMTLSGVLSLLLICTILLVVYLKR